MGGVEWGEWEWRVEWRRGVEVWMWEVGVVAGPCKEISATGYNTSLLPPTTRGWTAAALGIGIHILCCSQPDGQTPVTHTHARTPVRFGGHRLTDCGNALVGCDASSHRRSRLLVANCPSLQTFCFCSLGSASAHSPVCLDAAFPGDPTDVSVLASPQ